MTVTGHQRDEAWMGSASLEDGETFQVPYTIYSDDVADGPRTVIAYCESNIAARGTPYSVGNDSDLNSFVQRIMPSREPKSRRDNNIWRVMYEYGPTSEIEQRPDPSGNPSQEPINWQPVYTAYFSPRATEQTRARFLGAFEAATPGSRSAVPVDPTCAGPPIALDTVAAITNSAKDSPDPPVQGEDWDFVFRVTHWLSNWNTAWKAAQGKVNSTAVTITDTTAGLAEVFQGDEARMNIGASFRRINNLWRWEITWEFFVREGGWVVQNLDIGFNAWAGVGACKPDGTFYSQTDIKTGNPCNRRIITQEDPETGERIPVSEPSRLDASGQPVDKDDGCDPAWFLEWLLPERFDFTTLPIPGIS